MKNYNQKYTGEFNKENSNNIFKTFFDSYILTNILLYFILLKNNSYNILSKIHLKISNSILSQSIYNLVKKNDKVNSINKNFSEIEKNLHNSHICYIDSFENININTNSNSNSNSNSNEEWGWFIYFE